MSERMRARLVRAPAVLALLAALYVVLHTTTWMVRLWDPAVFWDSWSFVDHLVDWSDGNYAIHRLWEQHNEHRILFPRLVFFADHLLFGGRQLLEPALIWINQPVLALLLTRIARELLPRAALPAFLAFALAGEFSAAQMENLIWAFQVQFVAVLLAATLAIWNVTQAAGSRNRFLLALGCMFVATFTMANGMLVWPIGLLLAVRFRIGWARGFELAATAALVAALYLYGYQRPGEHSDPLTALSQPVDVLAYFVAYLGNPLHPFGLTAVFAAGGLGLLLFGMQLLAVLRRGSIAAPGELALLAVAAFAVGTALLTALGRVSFPLSSALTSRYASPALLFWIALGGLVGGALHRRLPQRPWVVTLLFALAVVPLADRQKMFSRGLFGLHERVDRGALALAIAPRDGDLLQATHPRPETLQPGIELLRARGWSTFAEGWHELPGRQLEERFRVRDEVVPGGVFSAEQRGDEFGCLLVRGWSSPRGDPRGGRRLVITDPAGRIVGLGRGGYGYQLALGRTLPPEIARAAEWQAIVGVPGTRAGKLRAYLVERAGGDAWPLAGPLELSPYESVDAGRIGAPLAPEALVALGGFAPRSAPAVAPVPAAPWPWWGSWVDADADVGQLTLAPVRPPAERMFVVPFLTGPSSDRLRLRVLDAASGAMLAAAEPLAPSPAAWRGWVVRLGADQSGPVRIVAEDLGVHWGQWIAIGPPCALVDD